MLTTMSISVETEGKDLLSLPRAQREYSALPRSGKRGGTHEQSRATPWEKTFDEELGNLSSGLRSTFNAWVPLKKYFQLSMHLANGSNNRVQGC